MQSSVAHQSSSVVIAVVHDTCWCECATYRGYCSLAWCRCLRSTALGPAVRSSEIEERREWKRKKREKNLTRHTCTRETGSSMGSLERRLRRRRSLSRFFGGHDARNDPKMNSGVGSRMYLRRIDTSITECGWSLVTSHLSRPFVKVSPVVASQEASDVAFIS